MGIIRWVMVALALGSVPAAAQVADLRSTTQFRVCADPANAPMSSRDGTGFENKLADAFYSPDFSFVEFLARHPQHKPALTELLMGRVFRADCGQLLDDLNPWLTRDPARPDEAPRVESS